MKQIYLKLSMLLLFVMVGLKGWGEEVTGTIKFGTNDVKISGTSVTGDDDLGNTWTITTVGTTSFTSNAAYYQVGSSKAPATSITFTTTLPESTTIKSMSANFGGFSGTAGSVTLKVGGTTIGTGSLIATDDVTVSSTSSAHGKVLTVTVTGIAKGVKCYNISYTYEEKDKPTHKVKFSVNGTLIDDDGEDVREDSEIPFPTNIIGLNGKAFIGWVAEEIAGTINKIPACVTSAKMGTENITYYALFGDINEGSEGECIEFTISEYAKENEWENAKQYSDFVILDGAIFVSAIDIGIYTGSYYAQNESWRVYQSDEGTFAINSIFGYVIKSVTFDYENKNTGIIVYNGNNYETNQRVDVANDYAEFVVSSTDQSISKGIVQIKGITVEYCEMYSNYCTTVPEALPASISSAGYATFVPSKSVEVPLGVTAYAVKIEGDKAKLTPVEAIPKNQAVVLKGGEGTYYFPETAEEIRYVASDLKASNADVTADGSQYILAKDNGIIGFYKATPGTTIAAGKAYLEISDTSVKAITFEEVTAIDAVATTDAKAAIYNLRGQRVSADYKGIVIKNGKKYLNK